MKPINFVGPVKYTQNFEFSKRAYGFEADLQGNRKLELQAIKRLTLPLKKRVGINNYKNIIGQ